MESEKTEVIYCRVNKALKKRLMEDADVKRGEAEAVIVRRALNEYFDRRDHPEKYPPLKESQHYQYSERAESPSSPEKTPVPELNEPTAPYQEHTARHKTADTIKRGVEKKRSGKNPQ